MNRFFQSASVAALALMLSGGAFAAPEAIPSNSATIAPPAASGGGTPIAFGRRPSRPSPHWQSLP